MWNKQQDCRAEKELRYSIRKYKFGAASVAIAALMFLGARVASADSVIENNSQPTTDVVNQKEKDKQLSEIQQPTDIKVEVAQNPSEKKMTTNNENVVKLVDKEKLRRVVEGLKTTLSSKLDLDNSVISPIKDRVQKGQALLDSDTATQKDVDELLSLLESDLTVLSNATKESSKVQETATENKTEIKDNKTTSELSEADKTISDKKESLKLSAEQLQAAVLELPEHESTKEVLEKSNELLGLAQGVIQNTTVSLNDVEDVTKRVKRMFNSVKNATTRLTSGARDSRNGQRMAQGTGFRANGEINQGALANIKYFASVDPNENGGRRTINDDPELTKEHTDIKAYYMQDSEGKWIVYDVFFNNNGRKITDSSYQEHYYFQAPFNIMDPSNTVRDLTFTRYRNTGGRRLSDGFQGFEQYGNTATITNPWSQQYRIFNGDRDTFYDPNSGVTRDNQRWDVFKNNQYDSTLNQLPKDKNGNYPGLSYYLGLDVRRESTDYAMHMHAKIKLKNDITEAEANAYGRVYAATVAKAPTANRSYIMGTLGTSLTPRDTTPPTITADNATVTKNEPITPISVTAEDNRGGVGMRDNNPIEVSGLPAGLTYANNRITGTPTGAPGNSTVTIKAYDKNGNMATKTITITVRSQADVYNPTGAGLTVNQNHTITDNEVKEKVSNFAPGTLTVVSKPSTANPGNIGNAVVRVTYPDGSSENVDVPVTVLEAPDTQPPTLTISPANQTVVEGETVTFTVTARDNKIVNLDAGDFLTKYGTRVFTGKASTTSVTDTNTEKTRRITITTTAEDVGKTNTITFNATDNANHSATPVSFTFTVTKRDNIPPTITAGDATVTSREQITPISVTAVDNTGGVGMRDNNSIEVSGLPSGLTYSNGRITGTPTGAPGNSTVTIKAYDKNGNMATKTITITVRSQAEAHNPTGETLTVPYNHNITDDEVKAKVQNFGPGTLTVQSKPSTNTSGNVGNAVVTVTYPDGSQETVDVPVVVGRPNKDDYTPKYDDGTGKPGARVEIPVGEANGKKIPSGTTFESDQPGVITVDKDGKVTVTIPEGAKPGDKITGKVLVRYPDGSKEDVPVSVTVVNRDKDDYTPKYEDGTGKPGTSVDLPLKEENGKDIPSGTTFESDQPGVITVDKDGKVTVTIPEGAKPGDKITGKVLVRYPDGSKEDVPVSVTVVNRDKDDYTPKYEDGTGKPGTSVDLPLKEENGKDIPSGTTFESDQPGVITVDKDGKVTVTIPEGAKPGDKITGKVLVRYPDGSTEEVPVTVTVTDQDKDIYTPKYEDGNGKPGTKVEIPLTEESGKKIPSGTTFESDQPGVITVDKDGKVTVTIPEGAKPGDKITGKVLVRYPDGSTEEVPVTVTVTDQDKDIYTPKYEDGNGKPGTKVEIPLTEESGKKIPSGTTFESDQPGVITVDKDGKVTVTIPEGAKPGDKITGKVLVRYPDGSTEEVPVTATVTDKDKDIYTPKYEDGNGKPGSKVEIPLTEESGKKIPSGTTFESDQPGVITVDKDGKVTVTIPEGAKPGDKITGKVLVRYPDGSTEEVPVTVTVTDQDKDIYTPKYEDGNGKPGTKVEIPVKPATNGGSVQDTPATSPTSPTPIPNAVTPNTDQVDTQTTIDNGAKSNDSQNVLPNTGTESNAALASLGLLGLLGGLGLALGKKKED